MKIKNPKPIRRQYNPQNLYAPVFTIFNRIFTENQPVRPATNVPIIKLPGFETSVMSFASSNAAPKMTGMLAIREYSAASRGGSPRILAVPIVEPDLEIPGNAATPCARPMRNACLKLGDEGCSPLSSVARRAR